MLHKFFNSFNPDTETDPFFGTVEVHFNEADNSYYLMKDISIGNYPENLSLTIESAGRQSSKEQFELFGLIESNFMTILETSASFMADHPEMAAMKDKNYEAEAIYIGLLKSNKQTWELSLINTADGSSYCIIEWSGLKPLTVSLEE